jgi:hypothetical protein
LLLKPHLAIALSIHAPQHSHILTVDRADQFLELVHWRELRLVQDQVLASLQAICERNCYRCRFTVLSLQENLLQIAIDFALDNFCYDEFDW